MLLNISPRPISPNKPFIFSASAADIGLPSAPLSPSLAPNNAVLKSNLPILPMKLAIPSIILSIPSFNFFIPPPVTNSLIALTNLGMALSLSVFANPSPAPEIAENISLIALPTVGSDSTPERI